METLVSDTSVLIGLDRGTLVEATFRLPFEFTVPDLLCERELKEHGGPDFVRLGLRIAELDGDGGLACTGIPSQAETAVSPGQLRHRRSEDKRWTLLSGDRELRELAEEEEVRCHGVLWLLDQMLEQRVIDLDDLHAGLGKIAAHLRCRLPKPEIRKRLLAYSVR